MKLRKSSLKFGRTLAQSRKDSTKRDEGSAKVMQARRGNAVRRKTELPFVSLASRLLSIPNFHQVEEVISFISFQALALLACKEVISRGPLLENERSA